MKLLFTALLFLPFSQAAEVFLGDLANRFHDIGGSVFALSDRLIEIRNFSYDGTGPAAYFWLDAQAVPSFQGTGLPSPSNGQGCPMMIAQAYDGSETVRVELPEDMSVSDYAGGSFSIWCEAVGVNFGELIMPNDLTAIAAPDSKPLECFETNAVDDVPTEIFLGPLVERDHDVNGDVYVLSERVLEIRNFAYDGAGPAAYWWIDTAAVPSTGGSALLSVDNTPSCDMMIGFAADGTQTVRVEFPDGMTINDFLGGSISVWCEAFDINFGEVVIPSALEGVRPSSAVALECAEDSTPQEPVDAQELFLGPLVERDHDVNGDVYVLSERVLEIRNFEYDGTGPAAYWWADTAAVPSSGGSALISVDNTPSCGMMIGFAADGTQTVRVEFPEGMTINDFRGGSISVWCEAFDINFGEVVIPNTLEAVPPTSAVPLKCAEEAAPAPGTPADAGEDIFLGPLVERDHDVNGEVYVLSERVLEIRNFEYDGTGPAAYWWIDTAAVPSSGGSALLSVANTPSCGMMIGFAADGTRTARVEFPEGMTINVWCEAFDINFGEIVIPNTLEGVRPTSAVPLECGETGPSVPAIAVTPAGYNCEELGDEMQIRWKVEGDMINYELVGSVTDGEYMAFGRSGSDEGTQMIGGDVVLADFNGMSFRARDLYMSGRAQCSNGEGVCPDGEFQFSNDVSSVSGESDFGVTRIAYSRPISPSDAGVETGAGVSVDRNINLDDETFIIWAIGPINAETGFPSFHRSFLREAITFNFGREVQDNCEPLVTLGDKDMTDEPVVGPFERPLIEDTMDLFARIGVSGGDRGYSGITGRLGWGIAWYVNDLLVPEIVMKRGTTYRFHVNGGDNPDPAAAAEFHPLYLTDSIAGGYAQLSEAERQEETIFAGIEVDEASGLFESTAKGPICRYGSGATTNDIVASGGSFDEFFSSLDTTCSADTTITDKAGILEFTPDENTPDEIFYQCVTHRNLGWKIRVVGADAPVVDDTPQDDTPEEDTPTDESPVDDAPEDDAPVDDTPEDETPDPEVSSSAGCFTALTLFLALPILAML